MHLDLEFPVFSSSAISVDHGYHLYAGLTNALASVHSENGIAVHPIRGRQIGDRMLQLMPWSSVRIRTPQEHIGDLIVLAGKTVTIGDRQVRLGVPKVLGLYPATVLRSRLVTIKGFLDADSFGEAVRRQLDALEISERVILTIGKRRTIRIRDKEVVGFEVILEGLTAQESITVQESGLGGRRHMGCGV
ncbi:MAG: type I-MYXAN CRISPR-associated protein Cas6/Cmx6, partial [Planctomycetaceae bacterium]|nr:type I-MYXAN CRISPR-associated protein Cas6/Cmx6 [Planctomycetaceae bacterium]